MIDEALQFALDFCQSDIPQEEIATRGQVILTAIHGRLEEIGDRENTTTAILGGTLKKLKKNEAWKGIEGVESWWQWGDFCREKIGKTAGYCYGKIRVWENAQKKGMTIEEIEKLGMLADHILRAAKDRNDIERLMARYYELGTREKFLAEIRGQQEEKPDRRRAKRVTFKLEENEDEFCQQTLEIAAKKMGPDRELYKSVKPEEALVFLMAQWREQQA